MKLLSSRCEKVYARLINLSKWLDNFKFYLDLDSQVSHNFSHSKRLKLLWIPILLGLSDVFSFATSSSESSVTFFFVGFVSFLFSLSFFFLIQSGRKKGNYKKRKIKGDMAFLRTIGNRLKKWLDLSKKLISPMKIVKYGNVL